MRLRQIALAATDLDAAEAQVESQLGLSVCHRDPGVGFFGLANALFCAGDTFIEIVSPTQPGTTAGRYLKNNGDSGYMVILQASADERKACIARAANLGIRTVWDGQLPASGPAAIAGTHFHPKDIGGAIVSIDTATPSPSWAWAGDKWQERSGPGSLRGVTMAVDNPSEVAQRWSQVLGVQVRQETDGWQLLLDHTQSGPAAREQGVIDVVASQGRVGLVSVDLGRSQPVDVCGVQFR